MSVVFKPMSSIKSQRFWKRISVFSLEKSTNVVSAPIQAALVVQSAAKVLSLVLLVPDTMNDMPKILTPEEKEQERLRKRRAYDRTFQKTEAYRKSLGNYIQSYPKRLLLAATINS